MSSLISGCNSSGQISDLSSAVDVVSSPITSPVTPPLITAPDILIPLSFDFLGAGSVPYAGFVTAGLFGSGSKDGSFKTPLRMALDVAGDRAYVVDSANFRIQKLVLSTGAPLGSIGNSIALGTCAAGKQNAWCTGGLFSAGNGDGLLVGPRSVAIDKAGDLLYVADSTSIKKFVLSTGAFVGAIGNSTATGTCTAGAQALWCTGGVFSAGTGDGMFGLADGLAIDKVGDMMYVTDPTLNRIQKYRLSTGAFQGAIGNSSASGTCVSGAQTTWCTGGGFLPGGFDGQFISPSGLALDIAGNRMYVVDQGNYRIQKFVLSSGAFVGAIGKSSASGTCLAGAQTNWCTNGTFYFGSADGNFTSPYDIVLDVAGDRMYVTDSGNYRVQKMILSTGAFVGTIGFSFPASGTCLQAKQNGWCTGGSPFIPFGVANFDGVFWSPGGLAIDLTNDNLLVFDASIGALQKFVLSSGAYVGSAGGAITAFTSWSKAPLAGTVPSGLLLSGSPFPNSFSSPSGIAVDKAHDRIYVAEGNQVKSFVLSSGAYAGSIGKSTVAAGTCVLGKQNNWCTGGTFTSAAADGALNGTSYLAADLVNDNLFVIDSNRIQKFVMSTGAFVGSIGMVVMANGTCASGRQSSWCVGGVPSGNVIDGTFSYPFSMAIDNTNGFFYVADANNARVQKFVLSTGAFVGAIGKSTASGTCVAGAQPGWCTGGVFSTGTADGQFLTSMSLFMSVAVNPASDRLYVGDTSRIQVFVLSTGAFLGAIGKSTVTAGTCTTGAQPGWCTGGTFGADTAVDGAFSSVESIIVDAANDLMFVSEANSSAYRIQKFRLSTGAFLGAIGNVSAAAGTCVAGAQTSAWCSGGTFSAGSFDGMFKGPLGMTFDGTRLYVLEGGNNRVQRFGP